MNEELKEIVNSFIDQLIAAGLMQQEDICIKSTKEHSTNGDNLSSIENKKRIVEYLNGVSAISNINFSNYCRRHGLKCKYAKTLEKCLLRNKFSYKTVHHKRNYYVKNEGLQGITIEDIVT